VTKEDLEKKTWRRRRGLQDASTAGGRWEQRWRWRRVVCTWPILYHLWVRQHKSC